MACPPIITGDDFLLRTLSHIDCQAQVIGSYGYQALGQPGSLAASLVLGLLTLFIAFFGIRMLFGPPVAGRDFVYSALKIGIVLSLAFSWPAFRTIVYDVTLKGPGEIASVIQSNSGNASSGSFADRLQRADTNIAQLTTLGTGRNSGRLVDSEAPENSFRAAALEDDEAFGSARLLYMSSVIGSLALLRVIAGLLLAFAPIVAGLYFFTQSRGIFAGWLKGLVLTIAGSVGATVLLSVQLAVIEPWLADALAVRAQGYATPSAPTELFAIMLAFAVAQLVMLWFLAKVVFNRGWTTLPDFPDWQAAINPTQPLVMGSERSRESQMIRAERISHSVESTIRREQLSVSNSRILSQSASNHAPSQSNLTFPAEPTRLGSTYRRAAIRTSRAASLSDGLRDRSSR